MLFLDSTEEKLLPITLFTCLYMLHYSHILHFSVDKMVKGIFADISGFVNI